MSEKTTTDAAQSPSTPPAPIASKAKHTAGPVRLMGVDIWAGEGRKSHCVAQVLGMRDVSISYEEQKATAEFLADAWQMEEFLKLLINGGDIVCTSQCTKEEIASARFNRHLFCDQDDFGYVYRPNGKPEPSTEAELTETDRLKRDEFARTLTESGQDVPAYGSPEWLKKYEAMGGS